MRTRRARRAPPPPTQYWLVATAEELARLLHGDIAAAIRTQAIELLHREPWESDALYAARVRDGAEGR